MTSGGFILTSISRVRQELMVYSVCSLILPYKDFVAPNRGEP